MVEPGFVVTYDDVQSHHGVVLAVDDTELIIYIPEKDGCAEISRGLFETRDEFFARRMVKSEIEKLTTSKAAELADQARQVYVNE